MNKLLSIALAALMFAACGKSFDASKLQRGMKSADVVAAVGEPDQKQDMPMGLQWWMYKGGNVVVVAGDTVVNVASKEDVAKVGEAMNEGMANIKAILAAPPAEFAKLRVGMTPRDLGYLLPDADIKLARQLPSGQTWQWYKGWYIELDTSLHVTRWMPEQPSLDSVLALQGK